MTPATAPDPRILTYHERQPIDADTINWRRLWRPSSGHPGGWRVTRDWPDYPILGPMQELEGKTGRLILFRSHDAAQRRAAKLNTP